MIRLLKESSRNETSGFCNGRLENLLNLAVVPLLLATSKQPEMDRSEKRILAE